MVAGSVAVERLRSLERQTESLTASQNNPARVSFPGGCCGRWSLDGDAPVMECGGRGRGGLQPVPRALQSVSASACPGFICTMGSRTSTGGRVAHLFVWTTVVSPGRVRLDGRHLPRPFKAAFLGASWTPETALRTSCSLDRVGPQGYACEAVTVLDEHVHRPPKTPRAPSSPGAGHRGPASCPDRGGGERVPGRCTHTVPRTGPPESHLLPRPSVNSRVPVMRLAGAGFFQLFRVWKSPSFTLSSRRHFHWVWNSKSTGL